MKVDLANVRCVRCSTVRRIVFEPPIDEADVDERIATEHGPCPCGGTMSDIETRAVAALDCLGDGCGECVRCYEERMNGTDL